MSRRNLELQHSKKRQPPREPSEYDGIDRSVAEPGWLAGPLGVPHSNSCGEIALGDEEPPCALCGSHYTTVLPSSLLRACLSCGALT